MNVATNSVFDAAGAANHEATRVVPVVSPGGGQSGFAQIAGSAKALRTVSAVVKIQTATAWSISAFIPVRDFSTADGTFHRVYGVAVDALISQP